MSHVGISRAFAVAFTLVAACLLGPSREVRGERVGYSFTGNFVKRPYTGQNPPTDNNAFGFHFPFTAPFRGTFSYDTHAPDTTPPNSDPNIRYFDQAIEGGFTFDVLNADEVTPIFRLKANAYSIQVTNDFSQPGTNVSSDLFNVVFDSAGAGVPPILRNDVPYSPRSGVYISAPISWDSTMFTDPELHADLPEDGTFPFQGTLIGSGGASFVIDSFTRISPPTGDYNIDGKVAQNDLSSWQHAFGKAPPDYGYADGNHDGIVDGGDYVIWRSALSAVASGSASASIPEPCTSVLVGASVLILSVFRRRQA